MDAAILRAYGRNLATTYWTYTLSIGLKTGWYTRVVNREIILTCGKCLELLGEMEAKDVFLLFVQ